MYCDKMGELTGYICNYDVAAATAPTNLTNGKLNESILGRGLDLLDLHICLGSGNLFQHYLYSIIFRLSLSLAHSGGFTHACVSVDFLSISSYWKLHIVPCC